MGKFSTTIFFLTVFLLSMFFTSALLTAGSVDTALYSLQATFTNTGTAAIDDRQAAFNLSAGELIAGNFIEDDALNALIHEGAVDIPGMPSTDRIQVEGAVQQDGGSFTEYTSEAQSTTQNDVPLLPPAAAVDDAFYFGCDNPCRIVTWDVDTVGAGTWTLTYEYWDGLAFSALTNVDDRTSGFTAAGRNTASWDMPIDWATRTTTGSAVSSYWGRARVSAFTSQTAQPLGTRVLYENGQWWTWIENLPVETQAQFLLFFGGATDLLESHQTFPGTAGIITGDAATIEVTGAYSIGLVGRFDFSAAGSTTCVLCKTGIVTANVSGSTSSPAIGTNFSGGVRTVTGDITGITVPDTGEQTWILASDGSTGGAFFGATAGGLFSFDPAGIYADNANNLTWASNAGIDYFESVRIDTAAPTVYDFDTSAADFSTGTLTNTAVYTGILGLANE